MKHLLRSFILLCLFAATSQAQTPSQWGVAAAFVPSWETSGALENLTKLVIDEESLGLSGAEFRIGIVRGRRESGDWGVSFVRRTVDDTGTQSVEWGSGCEGSGGAPGKPYVLNCGRDTSELTPNNLHITGVEVHKFFAFATVRERAQIGLNIAGGIGSSKGTFASRDFRSTYTCTFPPGTLPDYFFNPELAGDDPCTGATKSNEVAVQTGTGSQPFTRLMTYDKNLIPLGKVEAAVSIIVTPQFKVRLGGGMNFPGTSTIGVTGLYFFGRN